MRIVKIHSRFYRIYADRYIKDVFVVAGKIKAPVNQHNILTETEKQLIELEIKK